MDMKQPEALHLHTHTYTHATMHIYKCTHSTMSTSVKAGTPALCYESMAHGIRSSTSRQTERESDVRGSGKRREKLWW